jgi:hypothetical protein
MSVYIIQAGDTDKVKIGWSESPEIRLSDLQTSHWETLRIIRLVDGGPDAEQWFHRRFADQHVKMEWHLFHPDMMTVVPPPAVKTAHGDIIKDFGGARYLAEAIGVDPSIAIHWHRRGIPAKYWPLVEIAASQRSLAMTAHDLMTLSSLQGTV